MKRKPVVILPLASALGALAGSAVVAAEGKSVPSADLDVTSEAAAPQSGQKANTFVSTGESLLGFVMTEQPDGTVVAQHASHASHCLSRFACFKSLMAAPLIWWWNLVPLCKALELCRRQHIG